MRLLFVDDDPDHVDVVTRTLRDALDAEVVVVASVEDALSALEGEPFDLVVADIFIPLGARLALRLGPRSRQYEETLRHLGGLLLLDELDRLPHPPPVLAHTACTDFELIEIFGERVVGRVPKPAPVEVLLRAVLEAMGLPAFR